MRYTATGLLAALTLSTSSLAAVLRTDVVSDPDAFVRQAAANGQAESEGKTTYDGVELAAIPMNLMPQGRAALPASAVKLAQQGWTATADSNQPGYPPSNAIDGNANTFWHSQWSNPAKPLPHYITIDMKQNQLINSISYQPRQDGSSNGNIGQHTLQTSTDGVNFAAPKVIGTWRDDSSTKTTIFEATTCRYVRLTAITEAGNRGPWTSIAELNIYTTTTPAPGFPGVAGGSWSPTIDFPIVPVAAAIHYTAGNIVTWSSYAADQFGGSPGGKTVTATYWYGPQTVSQRIVTETDHDMFCPGISLDATGRILVTGGNDAARASIYTPSTNAWTSAPNMKISRGYQAEATVSNGKTFVIGGSWSGGQGNKNGEIYDPNANTWSLLPGAQVAPMLTNDAQGVYRADNHGWLFGWKGGYVFQAGPSKKMNWYNTNGGGSVGGAGTRGDSDDAMCGIAVMFDAVAGKILSAGGSTSYQNAQATAKAHLITLGNSGAAPAVTNINPMYFARIFHNGIVMPNGNVLIVGGQSYGQPFSDANSQLTPEIYIASTGHFTKVPNINVPRVYHSVAVLLADGTIFSGGGGLCGGCATNHFDGQVYSPGYLFNADGSRATRPTITNAPTTLKPGNTFTVTTNSAVKYFAMIRLGSATHTVNTDQRRIPLTPSKNAGNTYTLTLPNDYGIVIPGYYYLFAVTATDVPSISKFVQVSL